ncbi:uncharacterized mitochondrial protein-like protein [Tanacetum coccineum]
MKWSREKKGYANSTNKDSTVSPSVSTAGQSFTNADDLPSDPLMPDMEDTVDLLNTGIFSGAYDDDDDVGAEADLNNLETTINDRSNHVIFALCIIYGVYCVPDGCEECLFILVLLKRTVYVCQLMVFEDPQVYVDDIIFRSTKKQMINEFETLMHDKFQMSSMVELYFFLGLQVKQKSDGIFISQDKYVAEILKKFDFALIKTASTSMDINKALIKDEEAEDVDVHLYRSMIRSLMYLTASRPDIMFVVCACARDSPFDLEAFSDSDYVGASLDRKSTTEGKSKEFGPQRYLSLVVPLKKVGDEAVHKQLGDRMKRAATTASSLEAEQDSGSGPKCQDTILGDVDAQTRFETTSK